MSVKNLKKLTQEMMRHYSHEALARYAATVVARYETDNLFVSTVRVDDRTKPYETVVSHVAYDGPHSTVVVEAYDTYEQALDGHVKWFKAMTADKLPETLTDCRNRPDFAEINDMLFGKGNWEASTLKEEFKKVA